jgi:nitrogen PTS system EIIA component
LDLSVREASQLLKVSEKTIYRWISDNKIPAYRVHEQYRFNRVELLEWATARRLNVSPDIFKEPESGTPLPSLAAALQAGGIFYRIQGKDREAVLRNVVEHMRLPESVDRRFLLQVLQAREELGSMAIGEGIAIPHVRNPVVLHVDQPTITLCFLESPIEFGALDKRPVHALFTIISPTVRAHLHMLTRLGYILREADLKALITQPAAKDALLTAIGKIEDRLLRDPGGSSVLP